MTALIRIGWLVVVVAVLGATAVAGYRVVRAEVAADIYKARLAEMAQDYETLRGTYNEAVRRTSVSELVVDDGKLTVRVRSAAGTLREIETPYDPSGEIYVDYMVIDGRLWIRRVFDAKTAPISGVVIDPEVEPDWNDPSVRFGKAVYRSLSEGRWVVTVTGDGSLGLGPAGENEELSPPPQVKDYEELMKEADAEADKLAWTDVWGRIVHGR